VTENPYNVSYEMHINVAMSVANTNCFWLWLTSSVDKYHSRF